jgi:mannose-6-phosphate isomerase-like protein (cupin superfamily)
MGFFHEDFVQFTYELNHVVNQLRGSEKCWTSCFEKPGFEFGVLRLGVNEKDSQQSHSSDEVYFIIAGDGFLHIDGQNFKVEKNVALFVPRNKVHYFHSNTEELIAFYALN